MKKDNINIIHGDAIEEMKKIDDKSIDMILCDLPYGMTRNRWDIIIPLDDMWKQFKRIVKENGVIVLNSMQPFSSKLIISNTEWFKYEWIWKKENVTGFLNAKKQPLRNHENILIFYKKQCKYNPQMSPALNGKMISSTATKTKNYGNIKTKNTLNLNKNRYPKTIIAFKRDKEKLHPTQKSVALFEYLIETYSNKGATVLDCCIGSGTTAIACIQSERKCIGIEKNKKYIDITNQRIKDE